MEKPLVLVLILSIALICGGALVLGGCKRGQDCGYSFDGGSVELRGSKLVLKLEGNPTTGYQWSSVMEGDALELLDESYESDDKSGQLCGAGGVYTYTYQGVKAGTCVITYTYARSWESEAPADTLRLTVLCDESGAIISSSADKNCQNVGGSSGNLSYSEDGFVSISLRQFDCSAYGREYVLERVDGGLLCSLYELPVGLDAEEKTLLKQVQADESAYASLVSLCDEAGVRSWDGFSGSNPYVLDGDSFGVDIVFADGSCVSASGSNKYPKNYGLFCEGLRAVFES